MRLYCYYCGKSVSTEVNDDIIVRAILVCPECIEKTAELWEKIEKLLKFRA